MHSFNVLLPLFFLATVTNSIPTDSDRRAAQDSVVVSGPKIPGIPTPFITIPVPGDEEENEQEDSSQREEDLKNGIYDRNGDFGLKFQKETVTIGSIKLDDILKELRDACFDDGCERNPIVLQGQLIGEGLTTDVKNVELTLGPEGSFGAPHRENLLKMMEAAVREVVECKDYTHTTPCPNPQVYCPNRPRTVTRCNVPSYWHVSVHDPADPGDTGSPGHITMTLELEVVDDAICQDTYDTLSEYGGLVSGRLGDGLSLWKFACI